MHKLLAHFSRSGPPAPGGSDSLDAFSSESTASPVSRSSPSILVVIGAVVTIAVLYGFVQWMPFRAEAATASITIESDPRGAEVLAQGVKQGVTPLIVSIPPGEHVFEIIHGGRSKPVRVTARAGSSVVHHVQFDMAADAPPPTPAGTAGTSPSGTADRSSSNSAPSGPAAGWLAVSSTIPLEVLEGNQVIGTTAASRIMVPAGRKGLRFVNEALGFSERRTVQVPVGGTTKIAVQVPRAPISINAVPWAEVLIDGVRVGETPIGNHMVPIGSREIVFRHPELGERRQTVTVSLTTPARVSVNMRREQ